MSKNLSDRPGSLGPAVTCRPVDVDASCPWPHIHEAFREEGAIPLRQTWLPDPVDFEPGIVKMGHNDGNLLVYSDFDDRFIHNPATRFNDPIRPKGDFLEIILRPESQPAYYEMHVTPENMRSQFRFKYAYESTELMSAHPDKTATELFGWESPLFESVTEVLPARKKWYVLAQIPLAGIVESGPADSVRRYYYAFCRSNYHEGGTDRECSSTSELSEFNYHHQNEWGTLTMLDA